MKDGFFDVFDSWVEQSPDKILFRRLDVRQGAHEIVTYADLSQRIRKFAAGLEPISAPRDRIVLTFPSGTEFIVAFLGCISIGRIPVPYGVVRSASIAEKLARIINDCEATFSIAPASVADKLAGLLECVPTRRVLAYEEMIDSGRATCSGWSSSTADIAFLQYTSGSTGKPKGVIVTHGNLSKNIRQIGIALPTEIEHLVSWLPQFHDMGLVGATLAPIYLGKTCSFFSPSEYIQRPLRWLTALSELRANITVAPNFGYAYVLQRCKSEDLTSLDLSHVRVLMTGAEPVKAQVMRRFSEALKVCGLREDIFFPTYGLAESTVFAAGGPGVQRISTARISMNGHHSLIGEQDHTGIEVVCCGKPAQGLDLFIVDQNGGAVIPDGTIGEVCIRGPNVTPGYWGGTRCGSRNHTLRTGDLGFLRDGRVYITGRIKDLIIVRGRNIYPQDIESVAQAIIQTATENSCAVVMQNESLVLVQELPISERDNKCYANLSAGIVSRIAELFEVRVDRVIFTKSNVIPRTNSGKISRSALSCSLDTNELPFLFDTAEKIQDPNSTHKCIA
ncbi:MAG: fatty acyl-AMP ligase [Candidatus Sedimenticola endophacoides]